MFDTSKAFSGYSVDDLEKAQKFYQDTLGLTVSKMDGSMELLTLELSEGFHVMIYPKGEEHRPATYTVLNFPVTSIKATVQALADKGVKFEHYDSKEIKTDEQGITWSASPEQGPHIAWFKDPAGNILSVLEL